LEALQKAFNFGSADTFSLSDPRRQCELLACFLDDRAHLEMPQPRGAPVPDTIQAMWQVYRYLSAVGAEVGDSETDQEFLTMDGRSILDRIEADCADVRPKWAAFPDAMGIETVPQTMLELLYWDVTAKSKSIALTAVFGPYRESGIKFTEGLIAERLGKDELAAFQTMLKRVLAAKDPDHISSGHAVFSLFEVG
jgi:hypothetical protein